ncbi:MAG: GNAT family N-acetyltransferase [Actinomycetales bacterium]|nr:GNAT family N-acetyltransferase [Actinomycetales bacterium]
MTVTVRVQQPADADRVGIVLRAAFSEEPQVEGLERALASRNDSRGFVATDDGQIVGHVRITRGWVDAPRALVRVSVLSPLSVLPERQRQGVGRLLLEHAIRAADDSGDPLILLEGDPGYYGRLGWRSASEFGITPPSDRIPVAACQGVALTSYEPWMRGQLIYADTFWEHDCVGLRADVEEQATDPAITAPEGG